MKENIEKIGGEVDISKIKCEPCDAFRAGGYNKDLGILLCANYMRGRSHVEDTIAHELIHVYDDLKFNVNWDNLKHHACSEVSIFNQIALNGY
jgi:inner membrane protease ATP23